MPSKKLKEIANKAKKNDFISISELMSGIENNIFSRKEVSEYIFKESHESLKIGITGPPGAGKSSLMNKLIPLIRKAGLSVGVIAIDPSSPITGGSFLGDRVRINNAINDENVFVRSMGSRAELGGVTELAEDFSDILAFSGKDIIFIETVGVGQSEYSVSEITDLTTLVFVPESGDEIQLLKAGILELADIFVVNKSDRKDSNLLVKSIHNIISSTKKNMKDIPIFKTSCKNDEGLEVFADAIVEYFNSMKENEDIQSRQVFRYSRRIKTIIEKDILKNFWNDNRLSLLEKIDTASIRLKSPYKIVDEIKDKK
jgi:LAO/AO transport system kinase